MFAFVCLNALFSFTRHFADKSLTKTSVSKLDFLKTCILTEYQYFIFRKTKYDRDFELEATLSDIYSEKTHLLQNTGNYDNNLLK